MFRGLYTHIRSQWIGTLALFLALTGGAAFAAFNPIGPDGDLDLCFERRSGDLDVKKGAKCDRGERSFAINQAGPRGPQGMPGPQGQQGEPGPATGPAGGDLTGTYPNPTIAADEAPRVVGAAGEPTFGNGGEGDCLWQDFGPPFNPVSFYRGKDGRIHLAGVPAAQNGPGGCSGDFEDQRAFTLPPAYRPANVELFRSGSFEFGSPDFGVLIGADQDIQTELGSFGVVTIPAGAVIVLGPGDNPQGVTLDGLDFRAAGTGGF